MSSIFKDTTNGLWQDVTTHRIRWRFDKYGITPKVMICDHDSSIYDLYDTIELFTGTFTEPDDGSRTGDIDCDHETAIYDLYDDIELFTATYEDAPDLDTSGDIEASFEEFGLFMHSGLHMGLTMEPWLFQSYFNIEGEDMDSMFFEPFRAEMYGDHTYVSMELEFEPFESGLYMGTAMILTLEDWTMDFHGVTGYTGAIDLTMRRFEFAATGGRPAYIDLSFENFGFAGEANSGITASMSLVFRMADLVMGGNSDIVGSINASFDIFRFVFRTVGYSSGAVGNMHLVFRLPEINMKGIKGIDGDLQPNSIPFTIQMSGYSDGPNALELVFEEPEMGSSLEEEDCDLADILTYAR